MNAGRYVLSQILELVDRKTLARLVTRYDAESRVRHFGCRQQLICMVFAQLTWREGLRDITSCLNAKPTALHHLGFAQPVAKSTLADANEQCDWRLPGTLHRTLQVLSVHPFEKVPLNELLTETDSRSCMNSDPNQLNLF